MEYLETNGTRDEKFLPFKSVPCSPLPRSNADSGEKKGIGRKAHLCVRVMHNSFGIGFVASIGRRWRRNWVGCKGSRQRISVATPLLAPPRETSALSPLNPPSNPLPPPVNVTGEGRKPPALRPSINPSQPLSFLSAVSTFTFRRRTSVSRGIYFTTVGQTVYPSVYLCGIYSIFYRLD